MKIFFVSTPRGEGKLRENYQQIYEHITRLGYKHTSNFISTTSDDFFEKMTKGKEAHKEFYNSMIQAIKKSDICVFEVSTPSLGVGFLIQSSLENSTPTVVLYHKDKPVYFLSGIEDDKLVMSEYTDENLESVIKGSLKQAREKRDKRFNFFLSPKLLDYIDKVSKEEGITKSKLLRDLIVNHMRTNQETS